MLVLLPALPALALVFLGSWDSVLSSDAAPRPTVDLERGFLERPVAPSSFITSERQLQLAQDSQVLDVVRGCQSLLQGTSTSTFVYVNDSLGLTQLIVPLLGATEERPALPADADLSGGKYNVIVRLRYSKSAPGLWDNETPQPGAPSHFLSTGL
jgi:hypothetical protein